MVRRLAFDTKVVNDWLARFAELALNLGETVLSPSSSSCTSWSVRGLIGFGTKIVFY